MKKWKTLKTEYIHKSPFGNIRKDICEHPNGIVIDDYYVKVKNALHSKRVKGVCL